MFTSALQKSAYRTVPKQTSKYMRIYVATFITHCYRQFISSVHGHTVPIRVEGHSIDVPEWCNKPHNVTRTDPPSVLIEGLDTLLALCLSQRRTDLSPLSERIRHTSGENNDRS